MCGHIWLMNVNNMLSSDLFIYIYIYIHIPKFGSGFTPMSIFKLQFVIAIQKNKLWLNKP